MEAGSLRHKGRDGAGDRIPAAPQCSLGELAVSRPAELARADLARSRHRLFPGPDIAAKGTRIIPRWGDPGASASVRKVRRGGTLATVNSLGSRRNLIQSDRTRVRNPACPSARPLPRRRGESMLGPAHAREDAMPMVSCLLASRRNDRRTPRAQSFGPGLAAMPRPGPLNRTGTLFERSVRTHSSRSTGSSV